MKTLKMVAHRKKPDSIIYMMTRCWAPSLHQAVDTCLRFLYLTAFIRLKHLGFNLRVSALLSCHKSGPTLITVAGLIMAWFRVDKYNDSFKAHEKQ